jgi:regulatory protein
LPRPPFKPGNRATKTPRLLTPTSLDNSALYYVERFSSSVDSLRRALQRKIRRCRVEPPFDDEAAKAHIEKILVRFQENGMLNDSLFAQRKTELLHQKGNSAAMIRSKLGVKGVSKEDIAAALEHLNPENAQDSELEAARTHARKKKLGIFRTKTKPTDSFKKDLAAMGRAGFSYRIAKQALEVAPEEFEDDLFLQKIIASSSLSSLRNHSNTVCIRTPVLAHPKILGLSLEHRFD